MTRSAQTNQHMPRGGRAALVLAVALGLVLSAYSVPAIGADTVFADRVVSVAGKPMENYQGQQMDPDTYWWLTGPPDDVVSGWRSAGPPTILTMGFPIELLDGSGADLRIRCFGPGPYTVEASSDGNDFALIGDCTTGEPMVFEDVDFDFAGLVNNVTFIRIERTAVGAQTGRFFDSFEGLHPTPEPATLLLLAVGLVFVPRRR